MRLRPPAHELGLLEVVELVLLLVKAVVYNVEEDTTDKGEHSHEPVVPDQEWIGRQGDEGLRDGG